MRKICRLISGLLCCVMILSGCQNTKETPQNTEEKEETMQIGMSFDSFVIERWIRDRDVFIKTAKELHADVNVQNANGDVDKQISQIRYFIDKNMDAIVVIAVDGDKLTSIIKEALQKGIKVISYDRIIPKANTNLYITFDNRMVGTLMGQTLVEALPDGGKIAEIKGSEQDENISWVQEGFQEAIQDSNLEIVYEVNCDNWEADQAVDYTEEILKKYPDISGIMCGNDDVATRTVQVLAEHRLAGKVAVVGQDAELSACQRIVEGTQNMTVYKQVEDMAKTAAYLCVELIQGKDITSEQEEYYTTEVTQDGVYDIPYYALQPVAVNAENIDSVIINSGFHEKADVYLNVSEGVNEEG